MIGVSSLRHVVRWMSVVAVCLPLAVAGCSGGKWCEVFNGESLDGWKGLGKQDQGEWMTASKVELDPATEGKAFKITPGAGIMVNGPKGRTCDFVTDMEHGDCELHVEFMVTKGSNSGVYLMGRYEIQILDSFGKDDPTFSDCGGIYARWINNTNVEGHGPRVNAARPAGEWQCFDVIFRAPRFDESGKKIANAMFEKVVHNGQLVHEHLRLNGPTRGQMGQAEVPTGPLRLQGDHGPVAFRNIRIRPLD